MDDTFGPYTYELTFVQQDSYNTFNLGDDYFNLPDKDFVGDLDPKYGPLFSEIVTFAHLPLVDCYSNKSPNFDVAIIGVSIE